MKPFMLIILLMLAGCGKTDQKLEAEVFDKCLSRASESGNKVGTGDYDNVIYQCSIVARRIATSNNR